MDTHEQVAYPGYAYPATHPARTEVLGRLFGLSPAPADGCTVLELGCGDGGNSLAIAQALPGARVVGIDASPAAIERGRVNAAAAGLLNVELRLADLAELVSLEEQRPVDYIVAHGVYSWISPALRGALLECCRRLLAPNGIAFVSYNAYPGSYLRDMARDILDFHLRGVSAPDERLARAHQLMETIVSAESPSPYARVLQEHLQRMLGASDALLYHDELAPISTPFYFHEFMEHATRHELRFLSEADLADSQLRDVPQGVGELIASLPDDVIVREQYLDFFRNRMFRQTLLVHATAPVRRAVDDRVLEELFISSPATYDGKDFVTDSGATMSTTDPLVVGAMHELCDRWPTALPFAELMVRTARRLGAGSLSEPARDQLRGVLLDAYIARIVVLHGCPPPVAAAASEQPRVTPLAVAQAAAGNRVLTTLLPGNYAVADELERRLIPLLDGTRARPALAAELDADPDELDSALTRLCRHGLLCDA